MRLALNLVAILVSYAMWCFLMFSVLQACEVDRLVWFIFWLYMPLGILIRFLAEFVDREKS